MSNEEIANRLFSDLVAQRNKKVGSLMSRGMDYMEAQIKYDQQMAPMTTNAKMLAMIGIDPSHVVAPDESDESVNARLHRIIEGLSKWGVYITSTNHLDDREMMERFGKILHDEVRLIPPSCGYAEFIDMAGDQSVDKLPKKSNRDKYLPRQQR